MTKENQIRRQYFTAALTGLVANPNFINEPDNSIVAEAGAITDRCMEQEGVVYPTKKKGKGAKK